MLTSDEDLDEWIRKQAEQSDLDYESSSRDPYAEYMNLRGAMPAPGQGQLPQLPEQDHTGMIGAALGAGLDAILNKGRGVGKIAAATASGYSNDVNDRRKMEFELARAQAQQKQADPLSQYMEYSRIVNGQEANARQLEALTHRENLVDPNSAAARGQVQQQGAIAGAKTAGRIGTEAGMTDEIGQVAAARSEGGARGRETADAEFADAKRERDVTRAAEIAKAVGPVQTENAVSRAEQLAPIQRELAKGKADDVTAELGDRAKIKADQPLTAAQQQAQINEFNKSNKDLLDVASALRDLEPLIFDESGKRRPGLAVGPTDARIADMQEFLGLTDPEDAKLSTALGRGRTAFQHYATGAQSASAEEKRLAAEAADPHSSDERFYAAVSDLSKLVREHLAGSATGREAQVGPILKNMGLDTWAGLPQMAAPAPAAAPSAKITPKQDRGISQPAPLEGQEPPENWQPQDEVSPTVTVEIDGGPDGTFEQDLMPDQLQKLKAKGITFRVLQ